jgi:hypothetical protein
MQEYEREIAAAALFDVDLQAIRGDFHSGFLFSRQTGDRFGKERGSAY